MCAHAVRVAVGKIAGVESVNVSLKDGVATIRFAPSNRVTLVQIREAVRKNGFGAREAEVRVSGAIARRGNALVLVVPTSGEQFVLDGAADARPLMGALGGRVGQARVTVDGRIAEPLKNQRMSPVRLSVRSIVD